MSCPRGLKSLLVVCVSFVALIPAFAGDYPGKPLKSTTGAVFRSLAVPGWGQVYTENYWKAGAFFLAEASIAASISWNNDKLLAAKKADNFLFEKSYRNQRNKLIWWLAGTVLLSMGDAYVDAHMYGLDWSPEISLDRRGVSGGLAVAIRF